MDLVGIVKCNLGAFQPNNIMFHIRRGLSNVHGSNGGVGFRNQWSMVVASGLKNLYNFNYGIQFCINGSFGRFA